MLQDSPNYPHTLAQWLYVALAALLASGGTLLGLWSKRKHGPAEVRKIDAETRSILVRDDIALGDSVSRLIKEVAQAAVDAEERRGAWLRREEELRTQIRFWRNKAEELDGQCIDLREDNDKLKGEVTLYDEEIKTMRATLTLKNTNYDNTKHVPLKSSDKAPES